MLALAAVWSPKSASAATYLYSFTFTAQDVKVALSLDSLPREAFSIFLVPTTLIGYTQVGETVRTPGTQWAGSVITDFANLGTSAQQQDFYNVSLGQNGQPALNLIGSTTGGGTPNTQALFLGKTYTGTASAPVNFGGVTETFGTVLPSTTIFEIFLTTTAPVTTVDFSGLASEVTSLSSSSFSPKTDTKQAFNLNLTGTQLPEPSTWSLLLIGAGLMLARAQKSRNTAARHNV